MLFLIRLFGVTGSDAERYFSAEHAYAEEIVDKILQVQADTAAKQKSPLCRGTNAKGVAAAFRVERPGAFTAFASIELLWKVLIARRWAVLRAMTGQGTLLIREVARRVGRDVKAVHGDITRSSMPACSIAPATG
jgi:hypothetical protein